MPRLISGCTMIPCVVDYQTDSLTYFTTAFTVIIAAKEDHRFKCTEEAIVV